MKKNLWIVVLLCVLSACAPASPEATTAVEKPTSPVLEVKPISPISPIFTSPFTSSLFVSPLATPDSMELVDLSKLPTPMPSKAAIVGQIVHSKAKGGRPMTGTVTRLAIVVWNKDKSDGAYFLDGASSPGFITDSQGTFFFANIQPADYVLVVGDVMGTSVVLTEPSGRAKVFTAEAGKIVNIGVLEVDVEISL